MMQFGLPSINGQAGQSDGIDNPNKEVFNRLARILMQVFSLFLQDP